MPSLSADPSRTAGFSLIEVLVALAIVGLILAAAASVFGTGLFGNEAARDVATALSVAQNKLDAAGVATPLRVGQSGGVFAGRFRWRVAVARYRDKQADTADMQPLAAPLSPLRLYRIAVTVAWRDGLRSRRVALSTLRLARRQP